MDWGYDSSFGYLQYDQHTYDYGPIADLWENDKQATNYSGSIHI